MEQLPDLRKAALWAGGALLVIAILWLVAKTLLPFAIGVLCGAAATYFWKQKQAQ